LVGWLAGWLLTLEYVFGAAAASVGWSGYFVDILKQAGVHIPSALTSAPLTASAWRVTFAGTGINLPAVVLILVITAALSRGIRESSLVNVGLVVAKVAIALVIIVVACFYIRPANWRPFVPANAGSFGRYGWSGVLRAAGVVAFAFIGFDALANLAQEARTPRRDMPV